MQAEAEQDGQIRGEPGFARLADEDLAHLFIGGDRIAGDVLVRRYLPLARSVAGRFSHTREPVEDLAQVACAAFIAGLARFDPKRGSTLRSFALPTMVGELRKHIRDRGWSVHVPRSLQERARAVRSSVDRLTAEQGRSPTAAELGTDLGLTAEEVVEALEASRAYRADSLDRPARDDDAGQFDGLGYSDSGFVRAEQRVLLDRALRSLSERDRAIVELRFGRELSQSEIGRRLGISQMHVSRLLRGSLRRMEVVMRQEADPGSTLEAPVAVGAPDTR